MTPEDHGASATTLAVRRCPQFRPTEVLARTGKTLLVAGTYHDQPAVAKLLTDGADLWRRRFAAETHVYETFTACRPPVPAPRLLAADAEAGMLVLEHVTGGPVARERHPTAAPAAQASAAAVAAVEAVAAWTPSPGAFDAVFDYPERFFRYGPHGHGLLSADDVDRLHVLYGTCTACTEAWVFAHGDALPENTILTGNGPVLLDWEWSGLYLPGLDHALLWTVLHADPGTRARLRDSATSGDWHHRAGFWINAAMTVTREIRTHRELPTNADRRRILAALDESLTIVGGELAHLTETAPGR